MTSSLKKGNELCKIVAVDGPAGSGKSSVCAMACKELGWTYVNTGFLYRSIGLICRKRNASLQDTKALCQIVDDFNLSLVWEPENSKVIFEGIDISDQLQSDLAGKDASEVAKNPILREKLLPLQRRLALQSPKGAIVDGRDIGTVVFPDANLKVFLTASADERARRRLIQLSNGDETKVSADQLNRVKASILARDEQDSERGASPLTQASDAVLLDTSKLVVNEVVQKLVDLIEEKVLSKS